MHEQQPGFFLNRRQLIAASLGALVSESINSEVAVAPESHLVAPEYDYVSQGEIEGLEANLFETAHDNSLSLVPKDAIREVLVDIERARTGSEAIEIISAFTESGFGFPVRDITREGVDSEAIFRLQQLTSYLCLFPKELYEAIDLEKIDLGEPPLRAIKGSGIQASFTFQISGNTITFDPERAHSLYLVFHEIAHGLDYMSRIKEGDEQSLMVANSYLSVGLEAEDVADLVAKWMGVSLPRDAYTSTQLDDLLVEFNRLVPGLVQYVEKALQPYVLALTKSEEDYAFFRPAE